MTVERTVRCLLDLIQKPYEKDVLRKRVYIEGICLLSAFGAGDGRLRIFVGHSLHEKEEKKEEKKLVIHSYGISCLYSLVSSPSRMCVGKAALVRHASVALSIPSTLLLSLIIAGPCFYCTDFKSSDLSTISVDVDVNRV